MKIHPNTPSLGRLRRSVLWGWVWVVVAVGSIGCSGITQITCPDQLEVDQPGTFSVEVVHPDTLPPPVVTWDFGDGSTAQGTVVRHSYGRPGIYSVSASADTQPPLPARDCPVPVVVVDIFGRLPSLNSVSFERNASVLTQDARQLLAENVRILNSRSDVCLNIEGYASRDERGTQQLSEERAATVKQFYDSMRVGSRVRETTGLGTRDQKTTGGSQSRRVDSVSIKC